MTTFISIPRRNGGEHFEFRETSDELASPVAHVVKLGGNLGAEIPRQDDDVIRALLGQSFHWIYRNVSAGKEKPVLMRIPIDGESHELRADAAVIQQSVALARSAITRDTLPGTLGADEELEEIVADGRYLCREAVMAFDCVESCRSLVVTNARY
jgi:hypothetical protein